MYYLIAKKKFGGCEEKDRNGKRQFIRETEETDAHTAQDNILLKSKMIYKLLIQL